MDNINSPLPVPSTSSPEEKCDEIPSPPMQSQYDESLEYFSQVDEILDLIKPSSRFKMMESQAHPAGSSNVERLDHLENLIRLVQQLKELQQQYPKSLRKATIIPERENPILKDYRLINFERPVFIKPTLGKTLRSKSVTQETLLSDRHLLGKPKVSKWSKVKEAFRWEKTSGIETKCSNVAKKEPFVGLQIPVDKFGDSPSPADSILSYSSIEGASSYYHRTSSGYSSGHLLDIPPPPPPPPLEETPYLSISLHDLSSSSSDCEKSDYRTYGRLGSDDNNRLQSEFPERRSRSLDGENVLGPEPGFLHLINKDEIQAKGQKSHKTPWGKVKDIITHTTKSSVKKKKIKKEDKGYLDINPPVELEESIDPDGIELSLPKIELAEIPKIPTPPPLPPKNSNDLTSFRRLTPVLTITLPSTEELQNDPSDERKHLQQSPITDDLAITTADHCEDSNKFDKSKLGGRFSGWGKVKKAFFTSASGSDHLSTADSTPSSPLQHMSFFSDIESDEHSSGDWSEDKLFPEKLHFESPEDVQAEVQRNYTDLQKKFDKELVEKSKVWDPENSREGKVLDCDDKFQQKHRESMVIPLPSINDLSPDFKKKLDEWKKIKKNPGSPTVSREEPLHFISKFGEWQKWRPGGHKSDVKDDPNLPEEFCKKLEEWQKKSLPQRSLTDREKEDFENCSSSPNLSRKSSKVIKKFANSSKSSGCESLSGSFKSVKDKDKRDEKGRKTQKEKDLQWLEKEIQKVEREKLRLDREKEKFLEREARLEQMKRTISTSPSTQEVLIKTPIGYFRFEGISEKFTRKLYEWEKARGIGPEASTFALLESATRNTSDTIHHPPHLQRSKSVGSVIDISTDTATPHHPSSLSLNDVEDFEAITSSEFLASRGSSSGFVCDMEKDEPEAIIVDVEDIVEETAALMDTEPLVSHVPVYYFTDNEVSQTVHSGESPEFGSPLVQMQNTMRSTVTSTSLIDENIILLDKLEREEEICRKLKSNLEDECNSRVKTPDEAMNELIQGESDLQFSFLEHSGNEEKLAECLVDRLKLLKEENSGSEAPISSVSDIITVTTQLLNLAERLQDNLKKRNTDLKISKPKIRNKLGTKTKMWFSEDICETPDTVVNQNENEQENVLEIPKAITEKVLILRKGLMNLKLASENELTSPTNEEPGPSTSFTFKIKPKPVVLSEPSSHMETIQMSSELCSSQSFSKEHLPLERSKAQLFLSQIPTPKSPELIKRKIKEKISLMHKLSTEARPKRSFLEDENVEKNTEHVVVVDKTEKYKKLKARRITDTTIAYNVESNNEEECENPNYLEDEVPPVLSGTTPSFVFVPTSRKIISPVERTEDETTVFSYVIDDIVPQEQEESKKCSVSPKNDMKEEQQPKSEAPSSIQKIIKKYNQKIADGSPESNTIPGTSVPSWRSPILERRMKLFLEKNNPSETVKTELKQFFKSASAGIVPNCDENFGAVFKSSSAGVINKTFNLPPQFKNTQIPHCKPTASDITLAERALKLKQAKEEFLARGPGGQSWCAGMPNINYSLFETSSMTSKTEYQRKRISHISIASESSFDTVSLNPTTLIKSASAGMINVELQSAVQEPFCIQRHIDSKMLNPEQIGEQSKTPTFSIKGLQKFRKMRFRKAKCKEGAVSALCRQSLLLDMVKNSSNGNEVVTSKSCPSSPVLERNRTSQPSSTKWNPANIFRSKSSKDNLS